MSSKFIFTDFNKNILNISATLEEFLNCPNSNGTLTILKEELKKNYKTVVFIIFDGLGINPININLKDDSFIKSNIKDILTSVFPSTTTNATTTMLTNKYPMEHGWFAWSLYFDELKAAVNIFPGVNSHTNEPVDQMYKTKIIPTEPFYKYAHTDYAISKVAPIYWSDGENLNKYVASDIDDYFSLTKEICQKEGKQFIYLYCPEPDHMMHEYGVSSLESKITINYLNLKLKELYESVEDTLFIVTADHGQVDIDGYIELYKDEELLSLLEWPLFLEARAPAFRVKEGCNDEFVRLFNEKYSEDFELFETKDLIDQKVFCLTNNLDKAYLLGDYIALAKTNKIMLLGELANHHKGHHGSLTEEMLVPLILLSKK